VEADGQGRTKLYQVSERMYNIYYLMRRRGAPSGRVRAVVQFIISFYGEKEIVEVIRSIAKEACELEGEEQKLHCMTLENIWSNLSDEKVLEKCKKAIPSEFYKLPVTYTKVKSLDEQVEKLSQKENEELKQLLIEACEKRKSNKNLDEVERIYRRCLEIQPNDADLWKVLGDFLMQDLKKLKEAEKAYRCGLEIDSDHACLLVSVAKLLSRPERGEYQEAYDMLRKVVHATGECPEGWFGLGFLCQEHLSRFEEAEEAYRNVIELSPK
ncbi:unnamed protein product, partial [marine sediment metagenome]